MTISNAIDFIHEQRQIRGSQRVCRNWTDAQLVSSIQKAILEESFGWVTEGNRITGLCWGTKRDSEKVLWVEQVVCANKRALAHLMLLFCQRLPNWTIEGFRRKHEGLRKKHFTRIQRMTTLTQLP